ncbi:hypothetical protein N7463_003102 [Penicillium fimorum]|uniref:Uncharacterized protein n=1 Tax=Penicillium fimorum TaxID=1882269 RepID=A0A9W9Y147_9EURO|nr:hypothetical protein N7463_003102 [Penicillium fimorum]
MQLYRKDRFGAQQLSSLIEPTEPLIRVCLQKWHPTILPYSSCSLARCSLLCPTWMRLIPSLPAPYYPHHFSHILKTRWDAFDRTFALVKA